MNVDEFNIDKELVNNDNSFRISLVGRTNSGKSMLLYYLISKLSYKFKYIFFYTKNSEHLNPGTLDYYIWRNHRIYLSEKSSVKFQIDKLTKWLSNFDNKFHTLIIFDDVANFLQNQIYELLTYARHKKISVIMLLHDMIDINIKEREQLSHKIFTRPIDVDRDLGIKSSAINYLAVKQANISTFNESTPKRYFIYNSEEAKSYFLIIPEDVVIKIKNKNLRPVLNSNSLYKSNFIKQVVYEITNKEKEEKELDIDE